MIEPGEKLRRDLRILERGQRNQQQALDERKTEPASWESIKGIFRINLLRKFIFWCHLTTGVTAGLTLRRDSSARFCDSHIPARSLA